ncbi:hypothetical protein FGO68_gene14735 [Halteria grandinella]|uniref:Uncharacterized protein n=1 Tax=Halteria grandinella TaxID=5974 RepID=A0A8J8NKH7_HALGN|nr:hypothetical protein FGO68_gene14735 [Halteria grandinella]
MPYEVLPVQGAVGKARPDVTFKLIIIGNSAVGKSCIMQRGTTNEFSDDHEVTIGVEFGTMLFKMADSIFKLQIWDTAGQESFQSVTKIFYRGAQGVLLTYSVANMQSFQALPRWLTEIRNNCDQDAVIVLVGNQCDREDEREISKEQGQRFAKDNGIHHFLECSAKTGEGVGNTFVMSAKMIFSRFYKKMEKPTKGSNDPRGLKPNHGATKKGSNSCSC